MARAWSVLAVAVAVVAGGCSSTTAPGLVTGKWAQDFSFPGSSFEMTLVATGTEVGGTGNGCGEAGPCFNVAITGTSDATGVHLTLVFTQTAPTPGATSTSQFDGKLISVNTLRGNLLPVGQTQVADPILVVFHRE